MHSSMEEHVFSISYAQVQCPALPNPQQVIFCEEYSSVVSDCLACTRS